MLGDIIKTHLEQTTPRCTVGKWVLSLDTPDQNEFNTLFDMKINYASFYRLLEKSTQVPFKLTSFKSHMRGDCSCPKR
jgi:hypothetical protein